jgi:hypothetical protein
MASGSKTVTSRSVSYDYVPERPNAAQHSSNGDWLVENLVGSLMAQENEDKVGEINNAPIPTA